MAGFWFMNANARERIADCLKSEPAGRIISEEELRELRAHFPDGKFGELIFLLREGTLLVCLDYLKNASDAVMEVGGAIGFIGLICQKKIGIQRYVSIEANPRTIEMHPQWPAVANNYQLFADLFQRGFRVAAQEDETFVFLKDAARRVPKLLSGENVRLPEQGVIERSRPEQAAAAGGLR
ncbi:MAG: hypothetical protein O3C21_03300 [Verrucomicrobia bacterium]|nr:hypothetical protein [Verrucomicrobiota bacterium]